MNSIDESAISAMQKKGLALDANLAVVLIVGLADRRLVGTHRRTTGYSTIDFDLIMRLCRMASKLHTTPHVLSEVSNLLDVGKSSKPVKELFGFMEICGTSVEIWNEARELCTMPEFVRLGLADAGLCKIAQSGCAVATADWQLANRLQKHDLPAVNFHHLRSHLG